MRVSVDETKCVGSGQCAATASRVFDQRLEDGVVALTVEWPPEDEHDRVRRAAALCPVSAITVADD